MNKPSLRGARLVSTGHQPSIFPPHFTRKITPELEGMTFRSVPKLNTKATSSNDMSRFMTSYRKEDSDFPSLPYIDSPPSSEDEQITATDELQPWSSCDAYIRNNFMANQPANSPQLIDSEESDLNNSKDSATIEHQLETLKVKSETFDLSSHLSPHPDDSGNESPEELQSLARAKMAFSSTHNLHLCGFAPARDKVAEHICRSPDEVVKGRMKRFKSLYQVNDPDFNIESRDSGISSIAPSHTNTVQGEETQLERHTPTHRLYTPRFAKRRANIGTTPKSFGTLDRRYSSMAHLSNKPASQDKTHFLNAVQSHAEKGKGMLMNSDTKMNLSSGGNSQRSNSPDNYPLRTYPSLSHLARSGNELISQNVQHADEDSCDDLHLPLSPRDNTSSNGRDKWIKSRSSSGSSSTPSARRKFGNLSQLSKRTETKDLPKDKQSATIITDLSPRDERNIWAVRRQAQSQKPQIKVYPTKPLPAPRGGPKIQADKIVKDSIWDSTEIDHTQGTRRMWDPKISRRTWESPIYKDTQDKKVQQDDQDTALRPSSDTIRSTEKKDASCNEGSVGNTLRQRKTWDLSFQNGQLSLIATGGDKHATTSNNSFWVGIEPYK